MPDALFNINRPFLITVPASFSTQVAREPHSAGPAEQAGYTNIILLEEAASSLLRMDRAQPRLGVKKVKVGDLILS